MEGPLVPEEVLVHAGYQIFPSETFDLSKKQVLFKPKPPSEAYISSVDPHTTLVDLEEEWAIINSTLAMEIGAPYAIYYFKRSKNLTCHKQEVSYPCLARVLEQICTPSELRFA